MEEKNTKNQIIDGGSNPVILLKKHDFSCFCSSTADTCRVSSSEFLRPSELEIGATFLKVPLWAPGNVSSKHVLGAPNYEGE